MAPNGTIDYPREDITIQTDNVVVVLVVEVEEGVNILDVWNQAITIPKTKLLLPSFSKISREIYCSELAKLWLCSEVLL